MAKDILLENIRFFKRNNKLPNECIQEALFQQSLFEDALNEDNLGNEEMRDDVLNKIRNDDYIRNDYQSFANELHKNQRANYLTPYTAEEFKKTKTQTFQVRGYEIGFALKPMPDGNVDIISVHNNNSEQVKHIGNELIQSAIKHGGNQLDHFDGYLTDFYKKNGFKEYDRYTWDDQYAPKDWDYDKYGRPDVIMRRLKK